jgi:hypothetical protein
VQSEGKPERDSIACYQPDGPNEIDSQRYQSAAECRNCHWCLMYQAHVWCFSKDSETDWDDTCDKWRPLGTGEVHDERTLPADW